MLGGLLDMAEKCQPPKMIDGALALAEWIHTLGACDDVDIVQRWISRMEQGGVLDMLTPADLASIESHTSRMFADAYPDKEFLLFAPMLGQAVLAHNTAPVAPKQKSGARL
jgi:hypothetical protein